MRTFRVPLWNAELRKRALAGTVITTAGDKRSMGYWPLSALALTIGHVDSDGVRSDFEPFRRQELFFALLNLLLIGALLALQVISRLVSRKTGSFRHLGPHRRLGGASHSPGMVELADRPAVFIEAKNLHVLVPRLQLSARLPSYFHHHKRRHRVLRSDADSGA